MHDARDRNQGIWIEHNDRLFVAAYSSVASLVVMFSGYFRKMDGEIIEYAVTVNPTSDRACTSVTQHFGAGFLLSCVASLASGNAKRGQCYVRARVQRSSGTPAIMLHNVVAGYVTDDYMPSFPYGKIEGPLEGPGYLNVWEPANPAAATGIDFPVPTGARIRCQTLTATLTATPVTGSALAVFSLKDGARFLWFRQSSNSAAAGATRYHVWAVGIQTGTLSAVESIALPVTVARAGLTFALSADGIGGTDQFTNVTGVFEEWIET